MKHFLRTGTFLASSAAIVSALGLWAASLASPRAEILPAPEARESLEEDVVFHGSLELSESSSWNDVQLYGVHTFTANGSDPTPEGPLTTTHTTGGGFYLDGAYYCVSGFSSQSLGVSNTWVKYDAFTWELLESRSHVSPTLTDSEALAYDYIGGKAYASGLNYDDPSTPHQLRTIDLVTGEMTNVGKLDHSFPAMAFDSDGQLWGISREPQFPYTASLYKIDKNTGASTLVGALGMNQRSNYSAACFDHRTGKLYWTARTMVYNSHYEEFYTSYLCEIDLNTGKATPIKTFANQEVFSSLYLIDSHPLAPAPLADINFRYNDGSLAAGSVTGTIPTETYSRKKLSGNVKAEVYVDGKLADTKEGLKPGDAYASKEITLADGPHDIVVYLYSQNNFKSISSSTKAYGGADKPARVDNVTVTLTPHHDQATISWTAPTAGAAGGYLDPSSVTYTVVRRPDRKVIAEGISELTVTDTYDREQRLSQYEIIATGPGGDSAPYYTVPEIMGLPYNMPFTETFDSQAAFATFTVLDPKGIACADGDTWMWHPTMRNAIYWLNYNARNAVDAWLVTPTLNMKADYVYRINFVTEAYSTLPATTTLDICAGEFPTAESLGRSIYKETYSLEKNTQKTINTLFVAKENDMHIGIHALSDGNDHISVDNLRISEYGPLTIPAAPELESISKEEGKVQIKVRLPKLNVAGAPVAPITGLRLYSSDMRRLIATAKVDGGDVATIEDLNPEFGYNYYAIVAENEFGRGLDLQASINMKPDAPKPVQDLSITTLRDGADAQISWSYPSPMVGVDGNPLSPAEITYDIYRVVGSGRKLVETVTGDVNSILLSDVMSEFNGDRQMYITYEVVASTLGGDAKAVQAKALFGPAYELPIHEIFDDDRIQPWDDSRSVRSSFSAQLPYGYDPRAEAEEGNVLSFSPSYDSQCLGIHVSPRINLTSLLNPKMSFRMYRTASDKHVNATVQIGMLVEQDGREQEIVYFPTVYQVHDDTDGWATYEISLADYASYSRASFVIRCINDRRNGNIHFDCFDISGDRPECDARAASITGPTTALMGRENNYYVTVDNNGTKDLENVTVSLLADDKVVETSTVNLSENEKFIVPFTYTPALNEEQRSIRLTATVEVEGDMNRFNNSTTLRVSVEAPNLPYVTDLTGEGTSEGHVQLSWSDAQIYPNEKTVSDDFEKYPDFTIDNFGDWTMYDMDKANTMLGISSSMGSFTWENVGKPQAYIIFNPKSVGVQALCTPHSGDRCLVSFESSAGNDDWLVSPALSGREQTISFFTRCMVDQFPEKFDVLVSTSGKEPEDFNILSQEQTVTSSTWQKRAFTLPAGTRYFAIVCKTDGGFGFMLDDFEFVPSQPDVELTGYNVYRDLALIEEGIGETMYLDTTCDPEATYTYHVTATYTDGESIFSNPLEICAASVDGPAADSSAARIYSVAGCIVVKAPAGSPVTVHNIDGRCIYSFASTGIESMRAATGIYIVRAGDTTAKIIVK